VNLTPSHARRAVEPFASVVSPRMRIVILAAGVGSRLGNPFPKPLTELSNGQSILQRQLDNLGARFDPSIVSIVVGFKKEMIMEEFPDVSYIYNPYFGETNTSKSLLKALKLTGAEPVLWLNGDVVFDAGLLDDLEPRLQAGGRSFVAVNTASVGEEEVKYDLDQSGFIASLSKQVSEPLGEAVGINFVSAADKPFLVARLGDCELQDYFERGIELTIDKDGRRFAPVDVSASLCIEVDFTEDLARVNAALDSNDQ
jgi:L-glutamine-phosphate cytidylyltransferase